MARKGDRAEVIIAAVDRVAAPIRKINRALESMTAPARKIRRHLASIGKELNFAKLGRGLKSLGRGLRNIGVAAAAGIGAALFAVKKLSETGDDIAKLTKRLGFNTDAFQEYEHAAAISGVSTESYRKAVAKLAKGMGELKAGTGEMATVLDRVAPNLKKQLIATDDVAEGFELMLGFIEGIEDPSKKALAATLAFGRAGAELINLANVGPEGIKKLREEAQELGIVMSGEQLAASESMVDTFTRLQGAVTGVAREIGFELFPIVEKIAIATKDWLVANKEWLAGGFKKGIREAGEQLKVFWGWLEKAVPKTLKLIDALGGFKTIAIALGTVLALSLAAPLVLIVGSIGAIPTLLVAATAAILIFQDQIAEALNPVKWLQGLVGEEGVASLQASHAAQLALGGGAPLVGAPPELSGSIRMELSGAEPSSVSADLGGVGVEFEQVSNMPVE